MVYNYFMRVNFVNLGCPKNLVDSEYMIGCLEDVELSSYHKADCVIINTCGFIEQAKRESINEILKAVNSGKKVFVTGCMVYRYKEILKKEIPEAVFFDDIKTLRQFKFKDTPFRSLITKYYAYLKIAEGCNRKCSFCAIPMIRGKHTSKSIDELVDEAKYLKDNGIKELIIISQDTLYYGEDNSFKEIIRLLEALEKLDFNWIRLMYLYPNAITKDLIDLVDSAKSVLPYFDIPLQHISDKILKSMRRGYTKYDIYKLLENILGMRNKTPILRTSFIVGYPGESQEDFREIIDFVKEGYFYYIGTFKYSHEEGTYAYALEDKVSEEEKENRFSELFNISQEILEKKNKTYIGKNIEILIEDKAQARAYFQAPDIDGICVLSDDIPKNLVGNVTKANVVGIIGPDILVQI